VIKNGHFIKMVTRVHATESLPLRVHNSWSVQSPSPLHILSELLQTTPKSTFILKTLSPQKLRCLKSSRS